MIGGSIRTIWPHRRAESRAVGAPVAGAIEWQGSASESGAAMGAAPRNRILPLGLLQATVAGAPSRDGSSLSG